MRGYFCVFVSLLRGEYRDHIVPLRVNIPSQVFLISLERKREGRKMKEIRRKINIKRRKRGKKGSWNKEVPRKCVTLAPEGRELRCR